MQEKISKPKEGSVKLYKLNASLFSGEILNWLTFWEQFSVTVDAKTNLSDTLKLAYLRDALKDGPAKDVIAG